MDEKIEKYLKKLPAESRKLLQEIRATIKAAVPNAEESMGYGVPAFKLQGKYLVYYAAFKNHVGVYPLPSALKKFEKELSEYEKGKGTIKFPLKKAVPMQLIKKIVKFNAKEITKGK